MAYPEPLIKDARQLAADFERNKAWPKYRQGGFKRDNGRQDFEAIRQDPANATFTAQGWDPLYHIEPDATILIASRRRDAKPRQPKPIGMIQAVIVCGHR